MSEFFIKALSCSLSLHHHYQNLCHLPGFILLESSHKERGRYDILSAFPYDTLTIHDPSQDGFARLQQKLPQIKSSLDLPFQGGALGYFSYESGASLMGVSAARNSRFDDMPCMHMGFYDWAIIVDHLEKKITLFAANTRRETQEQVRHVIALWNKAEENISDFSSPVLFNPLITQEEYAEGFSAIHEYLKNGRCYQVNYTQPFEADFYGNAFALYKKIMRQNPVPFGAFFEINDTAVLSFSPERFLSMERGLLSTSPIKGTVKSDPCSLQDAALMQKLQNCEKNRAENVMIVDLLRNDLGRIAKPGSVKVTGLCELQSYKGLHHLVSTIEAECKESIHPVQAFQACFPGGSVTGTPKKEAMRVIQELEPYTRGIYCGSIGYFSFHGRFDSNIAIRTMVMKKNKLHLAAGGAIVIDSSLDDEYRECFTKIDGIRKVIQG